MIARGGDISAREILRAVAGTGTTALEPTISFGAFSEMMRLSWAGEVVDVSEPSSVLIKLPTGSLAANLSGRLLLDIRRALTKRGARSWV